MTSTHKICVFCGEKPKAKNKEHVIPRWLMEHIGISGEKVRFGFDRKTGMPREFAYKAFTFPACEECNTLFADLEKRTKPIVLKLLSEEALSKNDFSCLLDWFDKVRIGLWLAFYYLDKNHGGISPKFHIKTRISAQDRMLHIVKVKNENKELSFRGCDTLSFHFVPSCFSMIINNYCFYNISSPFLFARRIGFPFPIESYMREDDLADYIVVPGRERIMHPLLRKPFAFQGVGIYQPIFKSMASFFRDFYESEYVKLNSISHKKGLGDIFIQSTACVKSYDDGPTKDWVPEVSYDRQEMNPKISINTLEYQLYLHAQQPATSKLPKMEQKYCKNNYNLSKKESTWFIETMKNNAKHEKTSPTSQ